MSNKKVREASGEIDYPVSDWLTGFLYTLMRDSAPPGEVEKLVRDIENEAAGNETTCCYTNGWLAKYANHLANRIRTATRKYDNA